MHHSYCVLLYCTFIAIMQRPGFGALPPVPHSKEGPFDLTTDGYTSPEPGEPDLPEGDLFQGDIKVASKFIGEAGTARAPWPNAIIPYVFDCSVANLPKSIEAVREAMKDWEAKTCLRFVKKRPEHKAYLQFIKSSGCWATFVGYRKDTKTQISIGNGCDYKHVMVHELGHVIGFWHEQSRKDRDDYINVYLQNVLPALRYNFNKVKEQTNNFGETYDFSSIMHYPWTAFASQRGLTTISAKVRTRKVPYIALSDSDAAQIKRMYKCSDVEASRATFVGMLESAVKRIGSAISGMTTKCMDHSSCAAMADKTYCDVNPDPALILCAKSCGNCGPCVDAKPHCEAWAFYGFCRKHPSFMLKNCKKSCHICQPDPTTAPPPSTRPPPVTRTTTSRPQPTSKAGITLPTKKFIGVRCLDRSTNCKAWGDNGRCDTDRWVKSNCLLTCERFTICDQYEIAPIGKCTRPLGIGWEGKGVPDDNFYGTSTFQPGGGWKAAAYAGRLYRTDDHTAKIIGAWCAAPGTTNQYLEIDLGKLYRITAVATQGRVVYFEHVKVYYLSFSYDKKDWREYQEGGRRKEFEGNCDNVTPVVNVLAKVKIAKHIRFHPLKFRGAACLRVELYGCDY